jgi:hypothetical protein
VGHYDLGVGILDRGFAREIFGKSEKLKVKTENVIFSL